MPYNPIPIQELPNFTTLVDKAWFNYIDTDTDGVSASVFPPIEFSLCQNTGTYSCLANYNSGTPALIKSAGIIIAEGPPVDASASNYIGTSFQVQAVQFSFELLRLTASAGKLNVILGKLSSSQTVNTPSSNTSAAATTLQVTDPFATPSSSAGPAFVLGSSQGNGTTLSRTQLTVASNILAGTRVVLDLTQNIVATTAANSVVTKPEDFRLARGEKLVLGFIPTNGSGGADSGALSAFRKLRTQVLLSKGMH